VIVCVILHVHTHVLPCGEGSSCAVLEHLVVCGEKRSMLTYPLSVRKGCYTCHDAVAPHCVCMCVCVYV